LAGSVGRTWNFLYKKICARYSEAMKMELAGEIPYEDGDHCIFYAVQDANIHFNQQPLAIEDRDKLQRQRERAPGLYKAITGITEERGAWVKLSLGLIMEKLGEINVVPDTIVCTEDTKNMLEGINFIKREDIQFKIVEGKTQIDFPSLLMMENDSNEAGHVWFCGSEEDFENDLHKHIGERDTVFLVAHLKKRD
jgi:hypothetical protein